MQGNFEDWIFKGHRGYKSGKISEKYTEVDGFIIENLPNFV